MADCFYSCLNLGGCGQAMDCCHTCLYFEAGDCRSRPGDGYFSRRFSRYLNQ